jgi:Tol biopolymer transport system component
MGKTALLLTSLAASLLLACLVALVALDERAQAAFPGTNGRIAFASGGDGDFDLYVAQDDGSEVRQLTNSRFKEISPDWQPVR